MKISLPKHGRPDVELSDEASWQLWAKNEQVSLVMFSSGIDSTYTLVKLLLETNHKILVHHIHLINNEERFEIEAERTIMILELCNQLYRPFIYSESIVDHSNLPFFGYDIISVGSEAGIVAHSYKVAYDKVPDGWTVGTCIEEGHWSERFIFAKAACQANCFPHKAPNFFLLPPISKRKEMEYLPNEILEKCWTCRRPIKDRNGFTECGKCKTCILVKRARIAVSSTRNR